MNKFENEHGWNDFTHGYNIGFRIIKNIAQQPTSFCGLSSEFMDTYRNNRFFRSGFRLGVLESTPLKDRQEFADQEKNEN